MNMKKRKELGVISVELEVCKDKLEKVLRSEEDAMDSVPENLQSSRRYEEMENSVEFMDNADSLITTAIDKVQEAIKQIDEAAC